MKRMLASVVAAGVMLTAAGRSAAAQMVASPVRFGITGGAAIPVGGLSDFVKSGWTAGALVDIGLPLVPVGFRLDGTWNQFSDKALAGGGTGKERIIAGTANIVYALNSLAMTKFYLIGGVGVYNVKAERTDLIIGGGTTTSTKFGVNAGVGVRVQLTGFSTFAEARWHDVITQGNDPKMIPITVGITF
jgi:opacity protein-like surface antigen